MELMIIVLSKVSQTLKDKDPMFLPTCSSDIKKILLLKAEKKNTQE